MSVGEVDDGGRSPTFRAGLDEEPALRLEVLVHRPVKVEVILGQVREDESGEPNPDETLERRRVRRRLHRAASVAGVEHLAERVLEVDRLRGGSRHGPSLAADPALDGPEEAGPAARRGEDGVEQECRRRLPVRAGHAHHRELARGRAEERVGGQSHRLAGVGDDELRHGNVELTLHDESDGAAPYRVGGEVMAVRGETGNAEEERAGPDAPRVVGEVGDVGRGGVHRALEPHGLAEGLKLDGAGFYQRPSVLPRAPRDTKRLDFARGFAPFVTHSRAPRHYADGREGRRRGPRERPVSRRVIDYSAVAAAMPWSGGISRYWSAKSAILANAGAATAPPQIAPFGSSTVTRMQSRGLVDGTNPTNELTYFDVEYPPSTGSGFAPCRSCRPPSSRRPGPRCRFPRGRRRAASP